MLKPNVKQSAFTLIELLLVMVIMVMIMAMAMPALMQIGRGMGMRTATRNVHSTLSLSRQWAITHREPISFVASIKMWQVVTNATGNKVLEMVAATNRSCYFATNQTGEIIQNVVELPLGVEFDLGADPTNKFVFKSDGGLPGTATRSLKIIDQRNNSTIIKIAELTGAIYVE